MATKTSKNHILDPAHVVVIGIDTTHGEEDGHPLLDLDSNRREIEESFVADILRVGVHTAIRVKPTGRKGLRLTEEAEARLNGTTGKTLPVVVYGRHRVRGARLAAEAAGAPIMVEAKVDTGNADILGALVISENVQRREMTTRERAWASSRRLRQTPDKDAVRQEFGLRKVAVLDRWLKYVDRVSPVLDKAVQAYDVAVAAERRGERPKGGRRPGIAFTGANFVTDFLGEHAHQEGVLAWCLATGETAGDRVRLCAKYVRDDPKHELPPAPDGSEVDVTIAEPGEEAAPAAPTTPKVDLWGTAEERAVKAGEVWDAGDEDRGFSCESCGKMKEGATLYPLLHPETGEESWGCERCVRRAEAAKAKADEKAATKAAKAKAKALAAEAMQLAPRTSTVRAVLALGAEKLSALGEDTEGDAEAEAYVAEGTIAAAVLRWVCTGALPTAGPARKWIQKVNRDVAKAAKAKAEA